MRLLVYGSRDFGLLVRQLVIQCGHEFLGFVDDFNPNGPNVLGTYADTLLRYPPVDDLGIAIAIGYNHIEARYAAWEHVRNDGYQTPALVHRTAIVASSARVGEGSILMAASNVDEFTELGELTVLWPGAIVSHDCRIGPNCFLSPGSIVCGFVSCGRNSFLGAGSVVVDHRTLDDGAFVKAGAVYK